MSAELPVDLDVLRAGIRWNWETFPEYLASLEGNLGVNAGVMVGHSAVRYYVMGPDAYERTATPEIVRAVSKMPYLS